MLCGCVIIKKNALFSFLGSGGYASSSKSFIYSLYNINGYAPVKLQIKSGGNRNAMYRDSSYGPWFGGGADIHISNNAASNRQSHTYCGNTYPSPQGILHLILPVHFMQEATSSLPLTLKYSTRQQLKPNKQNTVKLVIRFTSSPSVSFSEFKV